MPHKQFSKPSGRHGNRPHGPRREKTNTTKPPDKLKVVRLIILIAILSITNQAQIIVT